MAQHVCSAQLYDSYSPQPESFMRLSPVAAAGSTTTGSASAMMTRYSYSDMINRGELEVVGTRTLALIYLYGQAMTT